MKLKNLVILLLLLTVLMTSISGVSAGWFDFLFGETQEPTDYAMILPNNTTEITVDDEHGYSSVIITNEEQTRYNGANYYHDDDKTTVTYTSSNQINMLKFNINVDFDVRELDDESTRNYLVDFVKSSNSASPTFKGYSSKDADSVPAFFTNPNGTNGGMYLKFYDADNNTVLTQNIVFPPSDDENEDYINSLDHFEYDEYIDTYSGERKQIELTTWLFINADSRDGMLDNLTKAERCELHILLTNGSNTDICIPVDNLEKAF